MDRPVLEGQRLVRILDRSALRSKGKPWQGVTPGNNTIRFESVKSVCNPGEQWV